MGGNVNYRPPIKNATSAVNFNNGRDPPPCVQRRPEHDNRTLFAQGNLLDSRGTHIGTNIEVLDEHLVFSS